MIQNAEVLTAERLLARASFFYDGEYLIPSRDCKKRLQDHAKWLKAGRPENPSEREGCQFVARGADLRLIELSNADLSYSDLSGAYMQEARLDRANLEGANLKNAQLQGSHLSETILREANLEGVNLEQANCYQTDFSNAVLNHANISKITGWDTAIREGTQEFNVDGRPASPITVANLVRHMFLAAMLPINVVSLMGQLSDLQDSLQKWSKFFTNILNYYESFVATWINPVVSQFEEIIGRWLPDFQFPEFVADYLVFHSLIGTSFVLAVRSESLHRSVSTPLLRFLWLLGMVKSCIFYWLLGPTIVVFYASKRKFPPVMRKAAKFFAATIILFFLVIATNWVFLYNGL